MVFSLIGLDSVKQANPLLSTCSKATTEFKEVKQDTICIGRYQVIIVPKVSVLCAIKLMGSFQPNSEKATQCSHG